MSPMECSLTARLYRPWSNAPPAGVIGRLERAENVSHDGWTEVMAVNVEGSYNAAHACYPHMVKAGR